MATLLTLGAWKALQRGLCSGSRAPRGSPTVALMRGTLPGGSCAQQIGKTSEAPLTLHWASTSAGRALGRAPEVLLPYPNLHLAPFLWLVYTVIAIIATQSHSPNLIPHLMPEHGARTLQMFHLQSRFLITTAMSAHSRSLKQHRAHARALQCYEKGVSAV